MDKNQLLDCIRSKYPNIRCFKKLLAKYRIKRTLRTILTEEMVELAEQNVAFKSYITDKCKKKWFKEYYSAEKLSDKILICAPNFVNRVDKETLRLDMLFCRFAYGLQPDEYLCFEIEGKSMQERREMVSDIDRYCYVYRMNDISDIQIFNNKGKTYQVLKTYYHREALYITSRKDYERFCDFIRKHSIFVRKAVYEGMGRSVELIDMTNVKTSAKNFFLDMISKGPHILEEKVEQSNIMAALNESSVNTVRCITLNTKKGIIVPYCFLKVGHAGSFVDNAGAGGIVVGIDTETGKLDTDGYDELNVRYSMHPDTKVVFKQFLLPNWKQMIEICKEMSAQIEKVKFIGWDMAHTDRGWVVIEGNGMSQLIIPQIVRKNGIKREMEAYMQDVELIL